MMEIRGREELVAPKYRVIADELARALGVKPSEDVLEVGAGTGLLARALEAYAPNLIISDISRSMLFEARRVLGSGGWTMPRMVVADVARLPFAAKRFDVVASALTPLQDSMIALREARRVLRPGGRIAVAMWGPSYSEIRTINVARRAAGKSHAPYGKARGAVGRLERLGFHVERRDVRFDVEHESVDAYLNYQKAFGRIAHWTQNETTAYYRALSDIIGGRFMGGPVRFYWNVTYLMANLTEGARRSSSL